MDTILIISDIIHEICKYIKPKDRLALFLTCNKALELKNDDRIWKKIPENKMINFDGIIINNRNILISFISNNRKSDFLYNTYLYYKNAIITPKNCLEVFTLRSDDYCIINIGKNIVLFFTNSKIKDFPNYYNTRSIFPINHTSDIFLYNGENQEVIVLENGTRIKFETFQRLYQWMVRPNINYSSQFQSKVIIHYLLYSKINFFIRDYMSSGLGGSFIPSNRATVSLYLVNSNVYIL